MKIIHNAGCDNLTDWINIKTVHEPGFCRIGRKLKGFEEKRLDARMPVAQFRGNELF